MSSGISPALTSCKVEHSSLMLTTEVRGNIGVLTVATAILEQGLQVYWMLYTYTGGSFMYLDFDWLLLNQYANLRRSLRTPIAVTAAPAPAP